jgi:predicted O-methyltransferase YrrM
VTSVEHNRSWYDRVAGQLAHGGLVDKCELICAPAGNSEEGRGRYTEVINVFPDRSFDLVVIDGVDRLDCMVNAIAKVKSSGLLVLDDAHRWFPNLIDGGYSSEIEHRDEIGAEGWDDVAELLGEWRPMLLTNGLSDMRLWIRP